MVHDVYVLDFPVLHKVFGEFDGSFVIAVNDSGIRSEMFSKEFPNSNKNSVPALSCPSSIFVHNSNMIRVNIFIELV